MAKCISIQILIFKLPTTCRHSRLYDFVVGKTYEPKSNILVIQTPIFECYVVRCGCESTMKTCVYKRLDLYGKTLGHLNSTGPIYSHDLQKIMGQMVLRTRLGFADHLSLIVCFIFHEEWVHDREKYLNNTRLP
jgi:hypothetical protein